jgi:hypothetical protein
MNSGQTICLYVWTDASWNSSKFLDTDGHPDGIATLYGRMLLTDERPDALMSHPDESLGSDFSELESSQNLP